MLEDDNADDEVHFYSTCVHIWSLSALKNFLKNQRINGYNLHKTVSVISKYNVRNKLSPSLLINCQKWEVNEQRNHYYNTRLNTWGREWTLHYLLWLCLIGICLEGEVRELLPLPPDDVLPPDEPVISAPRLCTFSRMAARVVSTSPRYGRRAGSPSQQFCISCQHESVNVGSRSGRKPEAKKHDHHDNSITFIL